VLPSPERISNVDQYYILEVTLKSDFVAQLLGVRIFYQLEISPPPAAATFGDVQTSHPFFPFIEALVAAGITGGCSESPPLFCPDGVVTRKQMAAFLARALGLHWAP
jgi:hypothetical protein